MYSHIISSMNRRMTYKIYYCFRLNSRSVKQIFELAESIFTVINKGFKRVYILLGIAKTLKFYSKVFSFIILIFFLKIEFVMQYRYQILLKPFHLTVWSLSEFIFMNTIVKLEKIQVRSVG